MFYSITGDLVLTEPDAAVIDCGGVAYRLTVSANTLSALHRKSGTTEKVRLLTYLLVRDDALELFGFFDTEELHAFRQLIAVSGVGAKMAIAILSVLTPQKLTLAVANGDAKAISQASGVGNKIAQRVILELKDKVAKQLQRVEQNGTALFADAVPTNDKTQEALNALLVLGYTRQEAQRALTGIDHSKLSLEECITAALKKLAKTT